MALAGKGSKMAGKGRRLVFLLSPAKTVNFERGHPDLDTLPCNRTTLGKETDLLLKQLQKMSKSRIMGLMNVSSSIADLNFQRYQQWETLPSLQAAIAFDGQAYSTLKAYDMSKNQLLWLNDHLRILSGFYGLIRPLDSIKAYRLEMGTKMENARGKDLYDFWGSLVTHQLLRDGAPEVKSEVKGKAKGEAGAGAGALKAGDCIIDVASKEYSKVLDFKKLQEAGVDIYEMKFPGAAVHAKMARGAIVRYAAEQQVTDPEQLKGFRGAKGDWRFEGESTDKKTGFRVFTFQRSSSSSSSSGPAAKKRKKT